MKMNIGPATEKYFLYLRNSKNFENEMERLRKIEQAGKIKEAMDQLDAFCDDYEVPPIYRPPYIYTYFTKVNERSLLLPVEIGAVKIKSVSLKIDSPALYLIIKDQITKDEWMELWKRLQSLGTRSRRIPPKGDKKTSHIFDMFGKIKRKKSKLYFDEAFQWYKFHRDEGLNAKQILLKRHEEGYEGQSCEPSTIDESIKEMKKLIKDMKREAKLIATF